MEVSSLMCISNGHGFGNNHRMVFGVNFQFHFLPLQMGFTYFCNAFDLKLIVKCARPVFTVLLAPFLGAPQFH